MEEYQSQNKTINNSKNETVIFYIFLSVVLLIGLVLRTEGLIIKTLLILIFAIVSWVKKLVPTSVTCLAVLTLLPLNQILDFSDAVDGFGSSSIWLLISAFILSKAITETGLDKRIALCIMWFGRGKSHYVALTTFITVLVFAIIIPSTVGRVAMLAPICEAMVKTIQKKYSGEINNLAKTIFIGIAVSSLLCSNMVMTGSMGTVYAVGMFETLLNYKWEYFEWFKVFFPGAILSIILMWVILIKTFPLELKTIPGGTMFIKDELKKLGKLNKGEYKLGTIIIIMVFLWFTSHWHGYPVVLIALLSALVTTFPIIGVINWEQAYKNINWDIIIIFGASLALASAIQKADMFNFIAGNEYISTTFGSDPYLVGGVLYILLLFIRLGFISVVAVMSVSLPLVLNFAHYLNYNPMWFGLIGVLVSTRCFLLPMQSPTVLLTYGLGHYDAKDMLRAGTYITIGTIIIDFLTIYIYWPFIGLHP